MRSKYVKLSELISERPRNGLYKGKEFQGKGHRWVKMSEVYGNDFFLDQKTELLVVTESEIDRFSCQKGDLLFGRTSLTLEGIGDCLLVGDVDDVPIFESNLFKIRFNLDKTYPLFYYYFFKSKAGKLLIQTIAKQTAATSITSTDLITLPVPYFSIDIQKKIADKMYLFDKKIELNRQTNQTLEHIAQALFKSWFVDFDPTRAKIAAKQSGQDPECAAMAAISGKTLNELDQLSVEQLEQLKTTAAFFPDALVDSELGEVPEGWESQVLENILELAYGKALKKTERIAGKFPVYGSGGLTGTHNKSLIEGPGIIVGRKGTVGKLYWEDSPFFPIDTVFYVKPKKNMTLVYAYYLLQTLGLEGMNTDAAVPGLNRNNAYRLEVIKPPDSLIAMFSEFVGHIRDKVSMNKQESGSLEKIRDTLLPKLLSGELSVNPAEAV